jgi:hypothetical protein
MSVYVALWDCSTCGNKANLGPQTKCGSCGSPRPKEVQFYLPENPIVVESEEELQKMAAGVDWVCGHCQGHNKAWEKVCNACAHPRDSESKDVDLQEKDYDLAEVPTSGQIPRKPNENELAHQKSNRPFSYNLIFIAIFVFVIGLVYLFTATKETSVKITGFEWERTTELEHNEIVSKEDWAVPSKAMNVQNFQAIHHYNQVFTGYITRTRTVQVPAGTRRYVCGKTSTGNGYFRDKYCTETIYKSKQESYQEAQYQQVPVYQTKYRFNVYEWVAKNTIKASAKNQAAKWASSNLLDNANEWREGTKKEKYWIYVKDAKGLEHKEEVGFSFWKKQQINGTLKAHQRWLRGTYVELAEPSITK